MQDDVMPPHVRKLIIRNTKHGLVRHPTYKAWKNMRARCSNPSATYFEHYGGRGISVCSEWSDFIAFYQWAISSGWKDGLQIDRVDVNGNYEPKNCRWVTSAQNNQNRRSTKLSIDQVIAIASDTRPHRIIASDFCVSRSLVWQIKAGAKWKTVTTLT